MTDIFWANTELIVFLHVISAVVWVGGMIAMRFAAHHSLASIEDPRMKLTRIAHALKRLFYIVIPFVIILIITAILMAVGWDFRNAAVDASGNVIDETAMMMYNFIHLKEVIWMLMAGNLGFMMWLRSKAEKFLADDNMRDAQKKLGLIGKYLVPLNILMGIAAIYLGVVLRYSH
ncbi:MAG TPA: hypothetical protein EYO73_09980 [Sulfurimonas sp.]|nr:hypothetical protein [Sulfurimonas sp.]